MTTTFRSEMLFELVRQRCSAKAWDWLDRILGRLEAPLDHNFFGAVYAGARRRVGEETVNLDAKEESTMQEVGLPVPSGLALDEICRAALLLRATECLATQEHVPVLEEIFQRGDNYERQALLRGLILLPDPERFLATAIEACRSSVQTVFEAIACDNPYPFRYFPELNFNHMVLKALFTGAPLARIIGLGERITPDLVRMAEDYAGERRAAGRSVPEDIVLVTTTTGRQKRGRYEAV